MGARVGFGYDVHRLEQGATFILGGVVIEHDKGPTGHSDADVLLHAICDAMLGAANLGDIGQLFPDNSEEWQDADSRRLLQIVHQKVRDAGYQLGNIDSTICLQKPKLTPYIPEMKNVIADALDAAPSVISVKATTTENLGFIGREEGISAYAVVLLQ